MKHSCGACIVVAAIAVCASLHTARAACVTARGRVPVAVESRCMNVPHDGRIRTYRMYTPQSPRTTALPLLIVLHGAGGSGIEMEAFTLGQFNRIADREGAVIVYPDAVGRSWNDGRSYPRSLAVRQSVDDVGFLRALVEDIRTQEMIDPARIYVTGVSNGGLMSYRVACDAADVVAAAAPVAANLPLELAAECQPSRMVPMVMINGTADRTMPWNGGEIRVLWSRRGLVLSAHETFERWITLGNCGAPLTSPSLNRVPFDGTALIRHVASDCADGAEVRLDEIAGGGHTWPGGQQYLSPLIVGRVSRELNASEEVWSFVSRFSRP